jgi:hypothetical protein
MYFGGVLARPYILGGQGYMSCILGIPNQICLMESYLGLSE